MAAVDSCFPCPCQRSTGGTLVRVQADGDPVPARSGGHRSQYADFTLAQVLTEPYSFEPLGAETIVTPAYAAEGWAWTDGKAGFLITKYGQQGMEWSLLDRVTLPNDRIALRWGGYGIYRGEPAHGAWLLPGESHQFGVTRLTAYAGGITEGYYAFREEMARAATAARKDLTRLFIGTSFTTTNSGGFPASSKATRKCARSITRSTT